MLDSKREMGRTVEIVTRSKLPRLALTILLRSTTSTCFVNRDTNQGFRNLNVERQSGSGTHQVFPENKVTTPPHRFFQLIHSAATSPPPHPNMARVSKRPYSEVSGESSSPPPPEKKKIVLPTLIDIADNPEEFVNGELPDFVAINTKKLLAVYKQNPSLLAMALPECQRVLAMVIQWADPTKREETSALAELIRAAPDEAFMAHPDTNGEIFNWEENEGVPFMAALCSFQEHHASLPLEVQDLLAERTKVLPMRIWTMMANELHDEILFNDDYSRSTELFSTKWLTNIFAGADPEEYTPVVFDSMAERMVDQKFGYFQACCPMDFYDFVRSRSASYKDKDAIDWEKAYDEDGDNFQGIELHNRMLRREKERKKSMNEKRFVY